MFHKMPNSLSRQVRHIMSPWSLYFELFFSHASIHHHIIKLTSSPARLESYTSVSQDAEVSFPPSSPHYVPLELVLRACFSHASIHRHIIKLPSSPARRHCRQESYTSVSQDAEVSFPPSSPHYVPLELVRRACFSHASIHQGRVDDLPSPYRQGLPA